MWHQADMFELALGKKKKKIKKKKKKEEEYIFELTTS
jgi:hypothetical protein